MSRISEAFKDNKAFIPFITCGDPDIETTKACIHEMVKNGADVIELGIPFSDPTAEGPVIQGANLRALEAGTTTDDIFDMVTELRRDISIPFVIMTYSNVVFSYGTETFIKKAKDAEIDGLILADLPFEEKEDFLPCCREYGIGLISLIAPTSENRIGEIARNAEGFVYIVSSLGVTGVRSKITTDINRIVGHVRENTSIPCAIGFGISTPRQAAEMSEMADGVIIGSAIIKIIAEHGKESPAYVGEYVRSIKEAINR